MKTTLKVSLLCAWLMSAVPALAQVRMCTDQILEHQEVAAGSSSGVYLANVQWTNGSIIHVQFNGGTQGVRTRIERYAKIWENYANITFDFHSTGVPDILIAFQKGGYWSLIGTNARQKAAFGNPTMNFEGFDDKTADEWVKSTVLHEFGHALGLLHEHMNPLSPIQWNTEYVYNYYFMTHGWNKQQVDQQVLSRYSVNLTNQQYDPNSIMHYPVDKKFTRNGYSVGWNSDLSEGDIRLIKEMYPKRVTLLPITTVQNPDEATCSDMWIEIQHNQFKDNQKGMRIYSSFSLKNSMGKSCELSAYFYYANGEMLRDFNQQYKAPDGQVAVSYKFIPDFTVGGYSKMELFIPYDELHMNQGHSKLKFQVVLWGNHSNDLFKSGHYYFDFTKGAIIHNFSSITEFNNRNKFLNIRPQFSIENGLNNNYRVCAYFSFTDGKKLVNQSGAELMFCRQFMPKFQNALYSKSANSDISITIPYNELNLANGQYHKLQYYLVIYDGNEKVATSGTYTFDMDMR
ncbi:MAG: hypothetical protein IM638_01385 [Bacteroidetes bacterium]|nr:hypothetical protein [Bacteroidota bacterium]